MKNLQKGFTLIELMIVIAILGILIAIALPAYQDYTVRAKVSEALTMAAPARLAVTETVSSGSGAFPTNNTAAGYSFPGATTYVTGVAIGANGIVTATVSAATGTTGTITLTPSRIGGASSAQLQWTCGGTIPAKHKPANCR